MRAGERAAPQGSSVEKTTGVPRSALPRCRVAASPRPSAAASLRRRAWCSHRHDAARHDRVCSSRQRRRRLP